MGGENSSRRRVLEWLGGVATGGLVAVAGHNVAGAKKAKKGKKGKKRNKKPQPLPQPQPQPRPQPTCAPGTPAGSVNVPATGPAVNTPVLTQGQRYLLRATGFGLIDDAIGNDAFAAFRITDPSRTETTFEGIRLGLSVNGGSPDQWGSYNLNHTYEQQVTGTGTTLSLRFTQLVTPDSSGSLTVDVFCA
jgi:hypothetical protein